MGRAALCQHHPSYPEDGSQNYRRGAYSDFHGKESALRVVLEANPEIFNHNLETVERLTPFVRSRAKYRLSLEVLRLAKQLAPVARPSSLMGLGEGKNEAL